MIEINNLTTSRAEEGFLKRVAEKVLKGENKNGTGLSIALVGEGRMREMNKRYRAKNRATDVLSFSYNGSGEIAICLREVKKNVKKFNSTFKKELARVLIHGILHLLAERSEGWRRTNVLRVAERSEGWRRTNVLRVAERSEGWRRTNVLRAGEDHETSELKTEPPKEAKVKKRTKPSLKAKKMEEKQENYLKLFFR